MLYASTLSAGMSGKSPTQMNSVCAVRHKHRQESFPRPPGASCRLTKRGKNYKLQVR